MPKLQTKVKIQKVHPDAIPPRYGSAFAAGADLFSLPGEAITVAPGQTVFFHTGIAMEIPEGLVGLVYARSGLACKKDIAPANKVGVIDSDYRGEIMVALHNHGNTPRRVEGGERIAQIVLTPYVTGEFEVCESLAETARGEGGFGSTGSK